VRLPGPDAAATNTVPAVDGTSVKDAVRVVLEAGLVPIVENDTGTAGAAGQVVRQAPKAGTSLRAGDLVRLGVRLAPATQERYVSLPNSLGGVLRTESASLRAKGLVVEVIEVAMPSHPYAGTGRVAAQYPVARVPLSLARTITLWVVK
jgi:beta-lactam-binding protein with PASTA domain